MANYAQDSDLDKYDATVRDQDGSFLEMFTLGTADILNLIKGAWWPQATGLSLLSFDESRLNTEALRQLTVYWTLYAYICPFLATFIEGDTWLAKKDHYKERYDAEWAVVKNLPLYDFDEDDTFEDIERRGPFSTRLGRG